jgi:hypothetical protein
MSSATDTTENVSRASATDTSVVITTMDAILLLSDRTIHYSVKLSLNIGGCIVSLAILTLTIVKYHALI